MTILSADDRRQFYRLMAVMVAMGLLEMIGIGSIMPFIAAVSNVDAVLDNRYLRAAYDFLGFDSKESFVIFLGASVLALLIARNLFFGFSNWLVSRFTMTWRHHLSERLLNKYLMQPYAYFLSRNTLELKRRVCNETDRLVGGLILPGIQIVTSAIVSLFIIALLIAVDVHIAALAAATLGGSYLLLYGLVFRKLSRLSHKADEARRMQFKIASEAFEGIKELKLFGKESVFVDAYAARSRRTAALETASRAISQLPRHGIELLAVSGVMVFILYLVATHQDLSPWMPILVVYVIAGYRMLPALQKIFSGLTTIQYNIPTLDALHGDLTNLSAGGDHGPAQRDRLGEFGRIETIELRAIDFRYPAGSDYAIHDLNLRIEKNTTVGLVGPTGSGKTTLVDIILGLLKPLAGELTVNGSPVTRGNLGDWQDHIGYVPQHIFLFDDTVARNVAFGVPDREIDMAALENALRIANLHDYVVHSLPDGYNTILGQRGIRLSGGQRQRIGIARAIYRNPDILVLDEATNALDSVTESVVMDAIQKLSHKLTIVIIAHRLNTVSSCDVIHYIDEGRVVSSGSYQDLAGSCEHFQKMVNQ
ncbi:MAG: ABC transporter ATP-binding protein/permease [Thiogranum sp.]|nr:ABC transporter ATP-binding protein/permease [Thiogranum sp.]